MVRVPLLRIPEAYAIIKASKKGDKSMGAPGLGSRGFKAGIVAFLLLAFLLAVISGDLMLVLAVGTAVGGVLLLGAHQNLTAERLPVSRPAPMIPPPAALRPAPVRQPVVSRRAARPVAPRSAPSARMAVRRSVGSSGGAHGRSANPTVSDSPGHVQVIQVLQ